MVVKYLPSGARFRVWDVSEKPLASLSIF